MSDLKKNDTRYSQQMSDRDSSEGEETGRRKAPPGATAIGLFLFLGATMAALAGTTLVWHGTTLDRIWASNPTAYQQLAPFGWPVGTLFLLLSASMAVAGVGWLRRRYWGWCLAVVIITAQVLGDLVNLFRGDFLRGGKGSRLQGRCYFTSCERKLRTRLREASRQALADRYGTSEWAPHRRLDHCGADEASANSIHGSPGSRRIAV
jgi:hypothetical protein